MMKKLTAVKWMVVGLLLTSMWLGGGGSVTQAQGEITLYTSYTDLYAPPGESISYAVDVINDTEEIKTVPLSVVAPDGWTYELTAGGKKINAISIRPMSERTINLDTTVPLKVAKGAYTLQLQADSFNTRLPLKITVAEEGIFTTELSTEQPNMEGHADSTFSFQLNLRNRTAEDQNYALQAAVPSGWTSRFTVGGQQVTAAEVAANQSETINVVLTPPPGAQAGSYSIPISASTTATSADLELEAVITGSYGLQLTTPTGLLSTEVDVGKQARVELQVVNTGSTDLQNVQLQANTPADWLVTFEPSEVESLPAGQTAQVIATIASSSKAIPGDYVTSMTASTVEARSSADFRVAVQTSVLWGWLGIVIILAVIAGIGFLFRKYGRR